MKTSIGISDPNRQSVADELSKVLADENVLYIKTKHAHWNVEDVDFFDKHKLFESQFVQFEQIIDCVAERIRTIGHYALGSMKSYLQMTHLTEVQTEYHNSQGFIKQLLIDHESIIINLRGLITDFAVKYQDAGSSDFITELMARHEKMAWYLRSHLENK